MRDLVLVGIEDLEAVTVAGRQVVPGSQRLVGASARRQADEYGSCPKAQSSLHGPDRILRHWSLSIETPSRAEADQDPSLRSKKEPEHAYFVPKRTTAS